MKRLIEKQIIKHHILDFNLPTENKTDSLNSPRQHKVKVKGKEKKQDEQYTKLHGGKKDDKVNSFTNIKPKNTITNINPSFNLYYKEKIANKEKLSQELKPRIENGFKSVPKKTSCLIILPTIDSISNQKNYINNISKEKTVGDLNVKVDLMKNAEIIKKCSRMSNFSPLDISRVKIDKTNTIRHLDSYKKAFAINNCSFLKEKLKNRSNKNDYFVQLPNTDMIEKSHKESKIEKFHIKKKKKSIPNHQHELKLRKSTKNDLAISERKWAIIKHRIDRIDSILQDNKTFANDELKQRLFKESCSKHYKKKKAYTENITFNLERSINSIYI